MKSSPPPLPAVAVGPSATGANALLPSVETPMFENWYVTTDFFANGGTVWQEWGPFPTMELALRVRELVEAQPRNRSLGRTFAVDRLAEKSRTGSRAEKVECRRCGVTVEREDECQVYNKVTGLAERPYCRACHDLRRFELADPAFICGHVEVYLNHAGETVGPYRCTLPERHEQPHSDGKVGWYTTAGAGQSAAPLLADNAHTDGAS